MKKKKNLIIMIVAATVTILFLAVGALAAYSYYYENNEGIPFEGGVPGTVDPGWQNIPIDKPIIYLYPTKTQDVRVELDYSGEFTSTYPDYDKNLKGWEVTANPNGSLVNHKDGKEYSYLFWEGVNKTDYSNIETGFVVKGSEAKTFLQSTLSKLGLTPKEYNEMIVYWLPKMEHNKYNLIYFAGKEYTDSAKLKVTPTPDSILRVFMVFKPLDKYQHITPQDLKPFERKGFTVVEWGGTELK